MQVGAEAHRRARATEVAKEEAAAEHARLVSHLSAGLEGLRASVARCEEDAAAGDAAAAANRELLAWLEEAEVADEDEPAEAASGEGGGAASAVSEASSSAVARTPSSAVRRTPPPPAWLSERRPSLAESAYKSLILARAGLATPQAADPDAPPKPPPPSGDACGLEADSSSVPFSAPGGQGKEARRAQRRLMAVLRGDASEMRRHLQQLRSTSEALNDPGTVMD